MADKKISELPFGQLDSNSIIPIVNAGTTSQTTFGNMLSQIPGGGGGAQLISCTKSELDVLVTNNSLSVGATYEISGVHPTLYDDGNSSGTTIFLQALTTNKLSLEGSGLFYNPTYDQSVAGYGIWHNRSTWNSSLTSGIFQANEYITADNGATGQLFTTLDANIFISTGGEWSGATSIVGDSSLATANVYNINVKSYKIGDKVIWGGYVWTNLMGFVGNSVNSLVLDFEWSKNVYDTTEIPVPTPSATPFTITSFVMIDGQLQMNFNPYDGIVSGLNVQVLINGTWYNTEEINDAYVSNESPVIFNGLIIGESLHRLQNLDNLLEFSNEFYANNIGTYNEPIIDNSGYNLTYKSALDLIHYDYENDLIIHREDTAENVIHISKYLYDITSDIESGYVGSPINVFQWGNPYISWYRGVGINKIDSSYCNNINFNGTYFVSNTLSNESYFDNNEVTITNSKFYNNTLNNSYFESNILSNSNFESNILSNSSFNNNTLNSNSTFYNNTLNISFFGHNTLNTQSFFGHNTLNAQSYFYGNTLNNNSYIEYNTLNNSYFSNSTLNNTSHLSYNTLDKSDLNWNTLNNTSHLSYNTLNSNSKFEYNMLNNSYFDTNMLSSESYIDYNTLSGSSFNNNTLNSGSYFYDNILSSGSYFGYNILSSESRFNQNELSGSSFNNNTLTNISRFNLDNHGSPLVSKPIQYVIGEHGTISVNILSGTTVLTSTYPKTLYSRPDGTEKVRYYDDNDMLVITGVTA